MSEKTDLQVEVFNDMKNEGLTFTAVLNTVTFGEYSISTGGRESFVIDNECYVLYRTPSKSLALPKHIEIREGDKVVLCAANGVEPKKDDKLTVGPEQYVIKNSLDISAGTQSLFLLVIRQ